FVPSSTVPARLDICPIFRQWRRRRSGRRGSARATPASGLRGGRVRLGRPVTRRLLFGSLALAPVVLLLGYFADLSDTANFVLGASLLAGGRGRVARLSSFLSLGLVGLATALFLIPAGPGWHGEPNRHSLAVLSVPISAFLLVVYVLVTWYSLRRHRALQSHDDEAALGAWSLSRSLVVLGVATVATALVAEILVGSLEPFAEKVGLSDFFVAAVIVAIVGNAAEHGGAVLVAHRGKISLAAEIALSSAAQVAVFLIPAVALLSWLIEPLALS